MEWSENARPFCLSSLCIVSDCCWLVMNANTGREVLEMRLITYGQPLPSGHPLTYSSGRGRQLFVFVTLESAIHIIVLGDNLQFIFMVYGTTPYVVMALKKGLPFKCVQNDMFRTLL